MTDLVYKESCNCGGSIEITTGISSLSERRDRISDFVNKHKKCSEVWAASFISMPMPQTLDKPEYDYLKDKSNLDEELNSMELAIIEQILRDTASSSNRDKSVQAIVTRMKNAGFKLTRMY